MIRIKEDFDLRWLDGILLILPISTILSSFINAIPDAVESLPKARSVFVNEIDHAFIADDERADFFPREQIRRCFDHVFLARLAAELQVRGIEREQRYIAYSHGRHRSCGLR